MLVTILVILIALLVILIFLAIRKINCLDSEVRFSQAKVTELNQNHQTLWIQHEETCLRLVSTENVLNECEKKQKLHNEQVKTVKKIGAAQDKITTSMNRDLKVNEHEIVVLKEEIVRLQKLNETNKKKTAKERTLKKEAEARIEWDCETAEHFLGKNAPEGLRQIILGPPEHEEEEE